ncbi:MAG: pyridoxamine 5'-phosphate oxidase family protein [Bacteroidota bacterium]
MIIEEGQSLEEAFRAISAEIKRGAVDKRHPFRFVTLATQGQDEVGLRYVVLRKVTDDFHLYIYTDSRSEKVKHLRTNQQASLLFYHPGKKLQVKVLGTAQVHQLDDLSIAEWKNVQDIGKRAYGPTIAPGEAITHPSVAYHWPESIDDQHFVVLEVSPKSIEALQLNRMEHLRARFTLQNSSWEGQWLAP